MKQRLPLFLCSLLLLAGLARAATVTLEKGPGESYRLLENGTPFMVRGAGGESRLGLLKRSGANAIRTWGTDQTDAILAEAESLDLKVIAGLWIDHERSGADYNDPKRFAAEVEKHCRAVDRLKSSPALLLWGVGNEVETQSTNPRVWDVIEAVAAYIRRTDPAHPVMVVTAHAPRDVVALVMKHCPSVQILGCNSYRGLEVLSRDLRASGWPGPYLVTEWGNDGAWEVDKTSWGAEVEPDSSAKAAQFARRHPLLAADPRCLGGLAFFWGQKQEATETWFNLLTDQGRRTEAVDLLTRLWGGSPHSPAAPAIADLRLNNQAPLPGLRLRPGSVVTASCRIDSDGLAPEWRLYEESRYKGIGGDPEHKPRLVAHGGASSAAEGRQFLHFRAPAAPGAYRLFLYGNRGEAAATANFPFLVEAPSPGQPAK